MLSFLSNPMFAWPLVVIATVIEVIWFYMMKKSGGLEIWPYNLLSYVIIIADVALLAIALKTLNMGTVYAFWTGASLIIIALIGIFLFNEPATPIRLFFIALVAIGIIGVNIFG